MLAGSFRLDTAQLIPRAVRRKQSLLLALLILAGCGHSSEPKAQSQVVNGRRFTFHAPAGWHVQHSARGATASSGSDLVQVSAFPLVRPYSKALFDRVAGELAVRMKTIAQETGGTVAGAKTVTAGGVQSHMYEVKVDGHVDQYTFVLIGKREYQLLCRSRSAPVGPFCSDLLMSFQPA